VKGRCFLDLSHTLHHLGLALLGVWDCLKPLHSQRKYGSQLSSYSDGCHIPRCKVVSHRFWLLVEELNLFLFPSSPEHALLFLILTFDLFTSTSSCYQTSLPAFKAKIKSDCLRKPSLTGQVTHITRSGVRVCAHRVMDGQVSIAFVACPFPRETFPSHSLFPSIIGQICVFPCSYHIMQLFNLVVHVGILTSNKERDHNAHLSHYVPSA
jgi:hypothetical protein